MDTCVSLQKTVRTVPVRRASTESGAVPRGGRPAVPLTLPPPAPSWSPPT